MPPPTASNNRNVLPMIEIVQLETERLMGYSCRPFQVASVVAVLNGKDVLAVQPTGSGKTWMFSISAILHRMYNNHADVQIKGKKVAFVVSPLTALIHQQVAYFNRISPVYRAGALGSEDQDKDTLELIKSRDVLIAWMTPEYLQYLYSSMPGASSALKIVKDSAWLWVLDEAHLFIDAGDVWRLSYKQLSSLRDTFPKVPIMALSASIPHEMMKILKMELNLHTDSMCEIVGNIDRPNIYYEVRVRNSPTVDFQFLLDQLREGTHPEPYFPCIIYCNNKQVLLKVADVFAQVCDYDERIAVFTSDSSATEKDAIVSNISSPTHKHWVILATTALGVGMNPDGIRLVVHYLCPQSFCDMFQESGRAGRNGSSSEHLLFYKEGFSLYVSDNCVCRRSVLNSYFVGGTMWKPVERCCDKCLDIKFEIIKRERLTNDVRKALSVPKMKLEQRVETSNALIKLRAQLLPMPEVARISIFPYSLVDELVKNRKSVVDGTFVWPSKRGITSEIKQAVQKFFLE